MYFYITLKCNTFSIPFLLYNFKEIYLLSNFNVLSHL